MAAKKKTATKKKAAAAPARRADYGSSVDAFVEKQSGEQRAIVLALRKLIEAAMPKADSSIRWGMASYTIDGKMAAAIRVNKADVGLILSGGPDAFKDPKGLLAEGSAKAMRQLKIAKLADLPKKEVQAWLEIAAKAH